MAHGAISGTHEERIEPREEVYHRTRATLADRRQPAVLVVNVSPSGLMLRSDASVVVGECVRVWLPGLGETVATVRWALGGRIGCQFEQPISAPRFRALLAAMGG